MADHIRYDLLTQQALRAVVRNVLVDVAKKGLPGEHHFYITFDTHADGVTLSQRLREQFPEKMTIILQHQFWDLSVGEESFEVGLSFSGVPERITVPFDAIGAFFDPSVQFGLQFEEIVERQDNQATPANAQKADGGELVAPQAPPVPAPAHAESPSSSPDKDPSQPETGGAEVVRLDRFRKK
ncbi:MAG TPA: ClpXP protease specificity-enhancing factor SspB [Pseudolabrys sp.]|nr:ClpXP protease specificity-enhancing factor SspB [Pseudolabrys sp.]